MADALKSDRLATAESVVRALYSSAVGVDITETEMVYEVRTNPATRQRERVLVKEKTHTKKTPPNPLACFFYLQNRDSARWAPAGAKGGGGIAQYTPEQVGALLRTSASAITDTVLGVDVPPNNTIQLVG